MRLFIIGVVTGSCVCVLAVAVLGAIAGYASPEGFPAGQLPGVPRSVVGCFWALAYYGWLAAAAGAFLGGICGGIATGLTRLAAWARRPGTERRH